MSVNSSGIHAARRRLFEAVGKVTAAGRQTPCQRDPEAFTPEGKPGPIARAAAASLCSSCPVVDLCHDYAETAGETWHVWGGVDRTEPRRAADSGQAHSQVGSGSSSPCHL